MLQEEHQKLEEMYGRDAALAMGTHRLQVLDTRAGGTNYEGIDMYFHKETLTINEATVQRSHFESDEEKEDGYGDG